MQAQEIIEVAKKYAGKNDSALLCIKDAEYCLSTQRENAAKERALRSLLHSVGCFSKVYQEVQKQL